MSVSPIALFVYNRPLHTRQTVEALQKNDLAQKSDLIIFSDGPASNEAAVSVSLVREFVKTIRGFKSVSVIENPSNKGLAASIISGVTNVLETHKSVIVLEDDLITSPYFLSYMNQALTLYENDSEVISIHGYVYPVEYELPQSFFLKGADCWGWATWQRGWKLFEENGAKLLAELREKNLTQAFDFNGAFPFTEMLEKNVRGENNSWAVRWYASAFLLGKLTLYPGKSLIRNIGFDEQATNTKSTHHENYNREILGREMKLEKIKLRENDTARDQIGSFLRHRDLSYPKRILKTLLAYLKIKQ